jgi:hypothetical protein
MDHPASVFAPTRPAAPLDRGSERHVHWQLARAAHVDLLLMGMPRINLLLIAPDAVVRHVMKSLPMDLWEPVARWSPGAPLNLPVPAQTGTMILHDVHALPLNDQRRLVEWLEAAKGRTQVVSTTSAPLLPLVNAGKFIATLFYRLNTVCVDVTRLDVQPS